MKLAICEWVLPIKGPAVFEKIKSLGIDGVQVDDWDCALRKKSLLDRYTQRLYLDCSTGTGVSLVGLGGNSLGKSGGMILDPLSPQGKNSIRTIEDSVNICEQMGIPIYLAPAFFKGFAKTVKDRKTINYYLNYACQIAKSSLCVTLECPFPANEVRRIYQEINCPNFGIYYDTQNPLTYGGIYIPDDIREIGTGIIKQIHLKDGADSQQGIRQLGRGETDFEEIAIAIKDINYNDWVVLENSYTSFDFESPYDDIWDRIKCDVETVHKHFSIE